jgi:uncharacterized protein YbbC (DUF1343 family)
MVLQEKLGKNLVALLAPQHGFHSTVQDNMIETEHSIHPPTGLPIYSLYSETREPTEAMLKTIDTMVIDIQIVGCRVYTFKYTIAACLRAAKKHNKRVVILDRPNPLGGVLIEGSALDLSVKSFVGEFEIPMRHGLTSAEAAIFFNQSIGASLEIIPMKEWNPASLWSDLNRNWVLTSPNLPTVDAVYIYPGTVLFEGTNISEGRGTGLPFQFIGAPFVTNAGKLINKIGEILGKEIGESIFLRETSFEPTSQKHKNQTCHGFQIHIMNAKRLKSYNIGLGILRAFIEEYPDDFAWKQPPYEYEYVKLPINLIVGIKDADRHLTDGSFSLTDSLWSQGISKYIEIVLPHLLYERKMIAH